MRVPNQTVTLLAALAATACVTGGDDQSGAETVLFGQPWVIDDIDGRSLIDSARATVQFGKEGRLSGSTSCNNFFADYVVDGPQLQINHAGVTKRACDPALMEQERRLLDVFGVVDSFYIDDTGTLVLSSSVGNTITARRPSGSMPMTTYHCPDGSKIDAWYPTTSTARIVYQNRTIAMTSVVSASGARYVGAGWQWWTKGATEGMLSPLADGETIASATGITCSAT